MRVTIGAKVSGGPTGHLHWRNPKRSDSVRTTREAVAMRSAVVTGLTNEWAGDALAAFLAFLSGNNTGSGLPFYVESDTKADGCHEHRENLSHAQAEG